MVVRFFLVRLTSSLSARTRTVRAVYRGQVCDCCSNGSSVVTLLNACGTALHTVGELYCLLWVVLVRSPGSRKSTGRSSVATNLAFI